MDQQEERQIIGRVKSGEREAYALLIEAYQGPIFNLALRMTGNYDDACDLAQETFIRAYRNLSQFDQDKKFFTWIYTISINVIRSHLKKKARDIAIPDVQLFSEAQAQESGEGDLISEESLKRLDENMHKLKIDLQEALILKFHQGLTFEEVAAITGDSVSAVKMRIYRGLEKLKQLMK